MLKVANSVISASRITGVLPVVNGGTGVTTSTGTGSTVLSAAPTLSGNVTLSTGNLIVASGQGIDFSATSSGSGTMTSELLADYEEGTFTPTVSYSGGNGTLSYSIQMGRYTKVGRTVQVEAYIEFIPGTASGNLRAASLPFAATGITNMYVAVPFSLNGFSALVGGINGLILPGTSIIDVYYTGTGGLAYVTASNTGASPWIAYCFGYEV